MNISNIFSQKVSELAHNFLFILHKESTFNTRCLAFPMKSELNLKIEFKIIFRKYSRPSRYYTLKVTFRRNWKELAALPYKDDSVKEKIWQ